MHRFHEQTYRLLIEELTISTIAIHRLNCLEERLNLQLPTSVREWYSHANTIKTLGIYSNDDCTISIQNFEIDRWKSHRLLPFKIENQGVCRWAILLDDSDDPPVFVNIEDAGWVAHADTFSQHIYSCVWDHVAISTKPALVQAQHLPLSESTLETLKSHFTEQIRTFGWPGHTQYRFTGDRQAILIWSGKTQADWYLAADDASALQSLLAIIWQLDGVGPALYECSELGRMVLQTFAAGAD